MELTATNAELAFKGLEFRDELDALLKKHGAHLHIGWAGKWTYLQVIFPDVDKNVGLTLVKCDKRGKQRYFTAKEEDQLTARTKSAQ